jgi:hypothetical protein
MKNMADSLPTQFNKDATPKSGVAWWVWLIIAIVVCVCLSCAAAVGGLFYMGRDPENITISYSMPSVVKTGENFDLELTIKNTGDQTVTVMDIDLDEALGGSILDGAMVLETEPHMERDYSISGIKTFKYNTDIGPGETQVVTFHLQATTVGEFGGSIGVYVGELAARIDYIGIIIQE